MKNLYKFLSLKFFDESSDELRAGGVYASSPLFIVLILVNVIQTFGAIVLVLVSHPFAGVALGVAAALSAVIAGLEWVAGLKARALNQLIPVVCAAVVFLFFLVRQEVGL